MDLPDVDVIVEPLAPFPCDRSLLTGYQAVLFVVDITDDYVNALTRLCALCVRVSQSRVPMAVDVLLHKAESLEEMERQEVLRDVTHRVREEVADICDKPPQINFYLTSIFDHSLHICLSRIIQRHLPDAETIETILDKLCNVS